MITMSPALNRVGGWIPVLMLVLSTGCGTSPATTFYTLSSTPDAGPVTEPAAGRIVVGVGPVEVSPYLERSQIVFRASRNGVQLSEFDQWIEPLESNIENNLVANLAAMLPAIHPISRPWPEAEAAYHVFVRVQRFDSDRDGNVILHAHWGILIDESESMPVVRESVIREAAAGADYESIVGTMSAALSELSAQIARELETVVENTAG